MAGFRGKEPIWSMVCEKFLADGADIPDGGPDGKTALPRNGLHGRRKGRALGIEQAQAWEDILPEVEIPLDSAKPASSESLRLCPKTLFPAPVARCIFEIGFGDGGHLAEMMARYPQDGFIGAEPFRNGIANFLKKIRNGPRNRIRVWTEDAMQLADRLAGACLDGIYILNPDPWPKKRHAKRRIVNPENLDRLARILKPGGFLVMTTDHDALAEWMVTQASRHPAFRWTAERADDWRTAPPGWIETRYEKKGRDAGRTQSYLIFERLP